MLELLKAGIGYHEDTFSGCRGAAGGSFIVKLHWEK